MFSTKNSLHFQSRVWLVLCVMITVYLITWKTFISAILSLIQSVTSIVPIFWLFLFFFNSIFCRFRKSVPFLSFFFTSRLILFRRNSMHLFLLTKQTNTYPKLTTERLALGDTRMTFTDFILMLLLLTLNIFHTSF